MKFKLSKYEVNSYIGDVFPVKAEADFDISEKRVIWSVDGDAAIFRSFENDPEIPFSDVVMVSLKKVGKATLTATLDGLSASCDITVRERRHFSSEDIHNYYRGDMHNHTPPLHNHELFINRTEGFQSDMLNDIKEEGLLDFGVMTDHSVVMGGGYEFVRAFLAEEAARPMSTVMFPGAEAAATWKEDNRLGLTCQIGGEVVVVNADNHKGARSWEQFFEAYKTSVLPILVFAHPQVEGYPQGSWNFQFEKICRHPRLIEMAKGMEMGNGVAIKANVLHEYSLSRALDAGFKITTTCGSDGHAIRGFKICPGKTIIMAPEKSREAFVDALVSLRAYACESANVKLRYTVNGMCAPCDLPLNDTYKFHVDIDYFEPEESTKIVKCQVVSDKGEWVKVIEDIKGDTLDFEIKSDTARYFYLRLQDREGRRTWSTPVWCSRPFDEYKEQELTQIDSQPFTATDLVAECDAEKAVRGDHTAPYTSENNTATILIDMNGEHEVSAVGYSTPRIPRTAPNAHSECVINHVRYPRRIRISTSLDGENFAVAYTGGVRTYSGEEIFQFERRRARFVKFEALNTVSEEYGRAEYFDKGIVVGILSVLDVK